MRAPPASGAAPSSLATSCGNGTKNKAVPLPPNRPDELKDGVKIEPRDLSGPGKQSIDTYHQAIKAGLEKTVTDAEALVQRLKATLSFTATPTITPRISAPVGGGGGAAASSASVGGGAGGSAGATRSAALRRGGGGNTFTGPINVHGVKDVASLHRGIQREADRQARDSRNDALHDTGNDFA